MNRRGWTAYAVAVALGLLLATLPLAAQESTSAEADAAAAAAAAKARVEAAAAKAAADAITHAEVMKTLEAKKGPETSPEARILGDPDHPDVPAEGSFGPDPSYEGTSYDPEAQLAIYSAKPLIKTPQPFMLGRRMYDRGAYTARPSWLGRNNPSATSFMAYGDFRVAAAYNDDGVPSGPNGETSQSRVAARLNLDLDFKLTATERFHAFARPIDNGSAFTRYDIDGKVEDTSFDEFDLNLETFYFEGDVGAMYAGWTDKINTFDLPIAVGLVPIITQNGVWIEDAFYGFAFALTAKNSPKLDISNFDFTFFAGFDRVTTGAVADDSAAKIYGMASFMDLQEGYLEWGYGYVDESDNDLSYHNVTAAWSKRYGHSVSNSIRVIGNFGQDPIPGRAKTADGVLLLIENSLITKLPSTLIPYINLFAGWDTPQSLARAAGSGGVLRNTGITFETDGLTGSPTLDARGHDSYGGAFGVEYLFNLDRSIIVEVATVQRHGDLADVLGADYGLGLRYQHPLTAAWILRTDVIVGARDAPLDDILGVRLEMRRKF